jgi:hypothetical protein
MKTYNEFMEQYSGREMGKTNDLASETMARRKDNERAAEQRRKEAEQKRAERESEAEQRKDEADRAREESLKEFTVPGFEGKRISVTKKPIRMINGKMAKAFPGKGTEGDGSDGSADGNGGE